MNPLTYNPIMQFWFCATENMLLTMLDINDELAGVWS